MEWVIPLSLLGGMVLGAGGLLVAAAVRARTSLAASTLPAPTPPSVAPAYQLEAIAELAAVRAEWSTFRKQLEAYLEAFQDIEESVERKRRRTAASASKLAAIEGEQPQRPPDLRAIARAQGLPV